MASWKNVPEDRERTHSSITFTTEQLSGMALSNINSKRRKVSLEILVMCNVSAAMLNLVIKVEALAKISVEHLQVKFPFAMQMPTFRNDDSVRYRGGVKGKLLSTLYICMPAYRANSRKNIWHIFLGR